MKNLYNATVALLFLVIPAPAFAGVVHCNAIIGLGVVVKYAGHNGSVLCERQQGSKYRVAYEEVGYNYNYGNAGSGHAHHHTGLNFKAVPSGSSNSDPVLNIAQPKIGDKGSNQFIAQRWKADAAKKNIEIRIEPQSFLQIDFSEVRPGFMMISRAKIAAEGGFSGTVELVAWKDRKGLPKVNLVKTGKFKDIQFLPPKIENGLATFTFSNLPVWSVPGQEENFDINLEGSVSEAPLR